MSKVCNLKYNSVKAVEIYIDGQKGIVISKSKKMQIIKTLRKYLHNDKMIKKKKTSLNDGGGGEEEKTKNKMTLFSFPFTELKKK